MSLDYIPIIRATSHLAAVADGMGHELVKALRQAGCPLSAETLERAIREYREAQQRRAS